jgi:hypothetical protein
MSKNKKELISKNKNNELYNSIYESIENQFNISGLGGSITLIKHEKNTFEIITNNILDDSNKIIKLASNKCVEIKRKKEIPYQQCKNYELNENNNKCECEDDDLCEKCKNNK